MMKRLFCYFLIGVISLSFFSCHKKTEAEKFRDKVKKVAVNYAKEELKLEKVDSVSLISIDTLTALAYVDFILPYVEEMRQDFQDQYEAEVKDGDPAELTELETKIEEMIEAENYYKEVVVDESVDNKKPLLILIRAAVYADGPRDIVNFFVTPDLKVYAPDPIDYSFIEN
ncbi:MAG: hypothetical protein J5719_03245 [Bacteroidales bacterium]|nr:hypothetical protein [Bacteroidales bacterium]